MKSDQSSSLGLDSFVIILPSHVICELILDALICKRDVKGFKPKNLKQYIKT